MAVLVALGTMNLAWMIGLAVLILLEKNAPRGEQIAIVAAGGFILLGVLLFVRPETLTVLT
jgi:predicted metal-binding membrane protein